MELTKRQQEVLDFLRTEHRSNGVMPSTREIQQHFGFASQTAAVSHLRALERKGAIERMAGKARALILPEAVNRPEMIDIPLFGTIPAGMATDNTQESEGCISVDVDSLGIPSNNRTFALRVSGDSMIDAHILSGDYVILEFRDPRPGDIVAALIDGETTLKRYLVEKGKPFLKAENPEYPNLIPAQELVIQGIMIALLRRGKGMSV